MQLGVLRGGEGAEMAEDTSGGVRQGRERQRSRDTGRKRQQEMERQREKCVYNLNRFMAFCRVVLEKVVGAGGTLSQGCGGSSEEQPRGMHMCEAMCFHTRVSTHVHECVKIRLS